MILTYLLNGGNVYDMFNGSRETLLIALATALTLSLTHRQEIILTDIHMHMHQQPTLDALTDTDIHSTRFPSCICDVNRVLI